MRSQREAEQLSSLFHRVARALELTVDVVTTEARGPVGRGVGPRLEALDVLSVLEQPQVRLSLSDEASSALLENAEAPSEGEPERLYVVMPMRL